MSKYIDFVKNVDANSWSAVNKKSGLELGIIEWHNGRRRYVVFLGDGLVFDDISLRDLYLFLKELNVSR